MHDKVHLVQDEHPDSIGFLPNKTNRPGLIRPALISIAGMSLSLLAFFLFQPPKSGLPPDAHLAHVREQTVQLSVEANGTVKPEREVKLSPKQAGLLKRLYVDEGDSVRKGQVIAEIDDSNLRGQIDASRAACLAAQQNHLKFINGNRPEEIEQSIAQVRHAESARKSAWYHSLKLQAQQESQKATLARDRAYAERQARLAREGAVSDQDALNAKTAEDVTENQLTAIGHELAEASASEEQAAEQLSEKRAQLKLVSKGFRAEEIEHARQASLQANGNLDYLNSLSQDTIIRAPFNGIITQKYADVGAFVTPSAAAATSSATSSSIVLLSGKLEVLAEVPESIIDSVSEGQAVIFTANATQKRKYHGVVSHISPGAISSSNITVFEVHIAIEPNDMSLLRYGMNVSTKFLRGTLKHAKLIPAVCIVSKMGRKGVFMPTKGGRPRFHPVQLGPYVDGNVVVLKGLSRGDNVLSGLPQDALFQHGFASKFHPPFGGR